MHLCNVLDMSRHYTSTFSVGIMQCSCITVYYFMETLKYEAYVWGIIYYYLSLVGGAYY